jgi:hypothetical protein
VNRFVAIIVALSAASCGYSFAPRAGAARPIHVAPIAEPGIDVDAAAWVNVAVRHAVARSPSTRLVAREEAYATLEVEMVNSAAALAPLADPGLRASQYHAVLVLRGKLVDKTGRVLWRSEATGDVPFLSTPGPIETLDGARRRALQRAAEEAADRLIGALTWSD